MQTISDIDITGKRVLMIEDIIEKEISEMQLL